MTSWWFFGKVLSVHLLCVFIIWGGYQLVPKAIPVSEINNFEEAVSPAVSQTSSVPASGLMESPVATSTVFFTGDVMLARHVEYLLTMNGSDYSFKNLGFLQTVPAYVVGNFEASIPSIHQKTPDFGYTFSVNKKFIPRLHEAGFTHLSLANNHSYDTGLTGFSHTKEVFASSSITTFGEREGLASTSITHLTIQNKSIAIIGIHTLVSSPTELEVHDFIGTYASTSDLVIAYIHWGNEYERAPSRWQQTYAKELVAAGIDVIIGHHPHVVQGVEKIGNSIVFYSLGNLIFDQYFSKDVQEGLVLKMVADVGGFEFELNPVTSVGTKAQPRQMTEIERTDFLQDLLPYSADELHGDILKGRISVRSSLATSSEMSMMDL